MIHSHSAPGTRATGGCGCGCGGSGKAGGSCSCKSSECQECQTPALVRPRFFAGQLLTEDDLEALTSYVVAKQRLHTRHLHGAGVVCGLEVVCHPCDRDKVTVQPGYALDCCGNDIAVPCPSELDILSMIRRLQLEKGIDCGDPCADRPAPPRKVAAADDRPISLAAAWNSANRRPTPDTHVQAARKYCLYVRYCEQPADPVKPYVFEEPCGDGSACEHSRVREGYRFELRCEEDTPPPTTILDRLRACADPEEMKKEVAAAEMRRVRYLGLERALESAKVPQPESFTANHAALLTQHRDTVVEFVRRFPAVTEKEAAPQVDDPQLRKAIDSYTELSRLIAKAQMAQAEGGEISEGNLKRAQDARGTVHDAEPLLRERVKTFTNTEDLLLSRAALDEGLRWTSPDLTTEQRTSMAAKLFVGGALQTPEIANYDVRQLAQLRDWLRRRIGSGMLTDCRLLAEVEAIKVEPEVVRDDAALAALRRRLDEALQRYIAACFCLALLPPCAPCDDTAVLLACMTVENCEVIDICNLERTFVLSWPAMRYWVPWFSGIGELFEELCCPGDIEKRYRGSSRDSTAYPRQAAMTAEPLAMTITADAQLMTRSAAISSSFAREMPIDRALRFVAPTASSAGTVSRLAQIFEGALAPAADELPAAVEAVAVPEGEELADALRSTAPRRVIDELIEERVEEIRPQRDLSALAEAMDDRLASVNTSLAEVRKELRRRPTATELTETKAVKRLVTGTTELKETNRRLEKANVDLAARVDALVERVKQLEAR